MSNDYDISYLKLADHRNNMGIVIDGEYYSNDDYDHGQRCDLCGKVKTADDMLEEHPLMTTVRPRHLGIEGYEGMASLCTDCLRGEITEEDLERIKEEAFEKEDEE